MKKHGLAHVMDIESVLAWIASLKEFQLDSIFGQSVLAKSYLLLDQVHISTCTDRLIDGTVTGSLVYQFELSIDDQSIISSCDCPFELGPCKHVAAVIISQMDIDFS